MSVTAIDAANGGDASTSSDNADVQKAFQEGVLRFTLLMLQSAQEGVIEAINDKTSNPDGNG